MVQAALREERQVAPLGEPLREGGTVGGADEGAPIELVLGDLEEDGLEVESCML